MGNNLADLLLINGNIITMDEEKPRATSIAVKNDTIVFVGKTKDALELKGSSTEVIDLKGQTVMPGFIESHIHPTMYGLNLLQIDCRTENTPSIDEILKKVEEAAKDTPDSEWIKGWGWDDSKLAEKRNPTRWDLDKVAPNHPVVLTRTCTHMAVVNSKALELSGITEETQDPSGGHIEKDSQTGEITGLLQEKAQGLVALPELTFNDILKGMQLAQNDFAKWGITTVHDMSTQKSDMEVYQELLSNNELNVRVRPWYWAVSQNEWSGLLDEVLSLGIKSGFGNDMIKIQGMKFMLDGGIGGRTAALSEPFEGSQSRGILYYDVEEIAPLMEKALLADLRVAIHGIGERAIEVAIQSFEKANKKKDITSMRNRIEHCALPTTEHLQRMKKLELVAGSSIGFLYHIGDSYLANLGPERVERVYPHKSFKDHGIVAPGNSDLPVTGGNPWTGIYAAVTRKTISDQTLDTKQNVSLYDAIKAYTVDAAFSSLEEQSLGSIRPSAKADLIVMAEDPFEIDIEQLVDIQIEKTYLGGKVVYSREQDVPSLNSGQDHMEIQNKQ
ncbi:amidohydrolase [Planococcus salinus]|uniref:Amidohydrolase n=1 Tax=Planococcus salinus TaxID=1848460 RepID=A0A3M8P9M9_9BACL|nr:amidohydrolase [Planococcus salinus]RNF40353.1 amidohydrolase [Planococcus salinus]